MELAWYCIFHNSRITTKWQTLATLKFEWLEVCTDFHGRQWWSLYLPNQSDGATFMLSFMRGNLNIHSAAVESVVYVCKAWHFQHTINLICHNTFHLSSIYHSLSPQDTVKPEEQEKLMWRHRSEVRRGREAAVFLWLMFLVASTTCRLRWRLGEVWR